ncbi:MAG: glycoside hydrolase family 97 C-terminal domain-containing protein, partial [Ginsengibacter sp.]
CIARRKEKDWYLGAINNSKPRTVTLSLDFLKEGNYTAEIYKDAADAVNHPNQLIKETRPVTSKDKLVIDLPSGGGEVVRIMPAM